MKKQGQMRLFSALLWLPLAAFGEDAIYKSIDKAGHVTYSAQPPLGSATVEDVHLPPGPTEESVQDSLKRASSIEEAADACYDAIMERRRQEAEARKQAQKEAEAAERQRQIEEALQQQASGPSYYYGDQPDWRRPFPPHPPHPPHPPRPPHPPTPPLPPVR